MIDVHVEMKWACGVRGVILMTREKIEEAGGPIGQRAAKGEIGSVG